jgi:hypothetical protein
VWSLKQTAGSTNPAYAPRLIVVCIFLPLSWSFPASCYYQATLLYLRAETGSTTPTPYYKNIPFWVSSSVSPTSPSCYCSLRYHLPTTLMVLLLIDAYSPLGLDVCHDVSSPCSYAYSGFFPSLFFSGPPDFSYPSSRSSHGSANPSPLSHHYGVSRLQSNQNAMSYLWLKPSQTPNHGSPTLMPMLST